MIDFFRPRRRFVLPVIVSIAASPALTAEQSQADQLQADQRQADQHQAGQLRTETPLDAPLADALQRAAASEDPNAFDATVRQALETNPEQQPAILRLAIVLRPDWAAALVGAGLAAKPDPSGSGRALTQRAVPATAVGVAPIPAPDTEAPPEPAAAPAAKAPSNPAFTGSVDFGGILRTGNTENAGVKGQLKLGYKPDRWEHKGTAEASYLRSEAETLEQRAVLEYEVNYDITDRLFAFGLANYTDDRFSGFDFETLSSAGLGVRLYEGDPVTWEVTAGPSLRYAEFSDSDESETAPGARFTNDISWQVSENALLANETEVLWDRERVTLENDASVKLRIVEKLSGKLSLNTRYRSNLPEDTKSTDTTTRASIVYDF